MRKAVKTLVRLLKDEQGAEGLEKLLIIAAIVLPLLGLLIMFKDSLWNWVVELWDSIKSDAQQNGPSPT